MFLVAELIHVTGVKFFPRKFDPISRWTENTDVFEKVINILIAVILRLSARLCFILFPISYA